MRPPMGVNKAVLYFATVVAGMAESVSEHNLLERSTIVDVDIHLSIDVDQVASYLDEPHRSHMRNPTVFPLPISGWNRSLGGKISDDQQVRGPEDIRRDLVEGFHIDYPIINATSFLPRLPQSDLAVALMGAYNDLVLERYLDENEDFRGLITLATQKPDRAAEELDRLGDEDQFVGVYLATSGAERPLGDERYDPIYAAAERHDLTIAMHGTATTWPTFPGQTNYFHKFLEVHAISHPFQQMTQITSLLARGVPERFDLRFVSMEAGIGWVPYIYRLDKEFLARRNEAPHLEKLPSEYFTDQFWVVAQPMEETLPNVEAMAELVGGWDRLLFATDWPHWDFDSPSVVRDTVPEEYWSKVYHENATEAFGL